MQIRQNLNIGCFFTNTILFSTYQYSVYEKVSWIAQDKLSTAIVVVTSAMTIMDFKTQLSLGMCVPSV
jgi:hypothetical protein